MFFNGMGGYPNMDPSMLFNPGQFDPNQGTTVDPNNVNLNMNSNMNNMNNMPYYGQSNNNSQNPNISNNK